MPDNDMKVAAFLLVAFGGGILLGYFLAPKATTDSTGGYIPLYVPACDEIEE